MRCDCDGYPQGGAKVILAGALFGLSLTSLRVYSWDLYIKVESFLVRGIYQIESVVLLLYQCASIQKSRISSVKQE